MEDVLLMALTDFFIKVPEKKADDIRKEIESKTFEEYNLIDVRQPKEYEAGHIPGAKNIPMRELSSRLSEIDPSRPTITY